MLLKIETAEFKISSKRIVLSSLLSWASILKSEYSISHLEKYFSLFIHVNQVICLEFFYL
jgi:hypothetical protein